MPPVNWTLLLTVILALGAALIVFFLVHKILAPHGPGRILLALEVIAFVLVLGMIALKEVWEFATLILRADPSARFEFSLRDITIVFLALGASYGMYAWVSRHLGPGPPP